jgi:hypothetical protein
MTEGEPRQTAKYEILDFGFADASFGRGTTTIHIPYLVPSHKTASAG